jgi:membrane peptidoglycan carboxypeptidase
VPLLACDRLDPDQRGRVSNQDLPGPYWQDQDNSGYRRSSSDGGSSGRKAEWDDGHFWRPEGRSGGRGEGSQRGGGSRHAARAIRGLTDSWPDLLGGQRIRARQGDDGSASGRAPAGYRQPSHTADDLRKRLGIRGSAGRNGSRRGGGQAGDDFWETPGRSNAGSRERGGAGAVNGRRAPGAPASGYRGTRRAGNGTGAYRDYGGTRTALRDQADFWAGDEAGGTGVRTRVGGRPGAGRGAGGGRGSGGRGGGRNGWDRGSSRARGGGFKNWLLYGSWWRHWTWKKLFALLGGAVAAFILLCIGAFFLMYSLTKIPTAETEAASWQSSNVYLANGQLLGTFTNGGQTRELLTANQIPSVMTEAMTAAEDRNFYHEGGISVTGLMRATYEDVLGGGNLQGGSTITMQYAKNAYAGVDTGQNISTKLKEVFIAMKLAHERSKQWVMTNYLNTVPFGPTTYGLGAAAEYYFDVNLTKPGAHLTIAQAAMLAAMPNAPGAFDPNPSAGPAYTALVQRWKYVLGNMVRDGNITQQQEATVVQKGFPKVSQANIAGLTGVKGYLWTMVQQELEAPKSFGGYGLTQRQLDTGGYKITTTFNMGKIRQLAQSVTYETGQIKALSGTSMPSYDWIGSVLENVKTGAILAIDGGPGWGAKNCNKTNVSCDLNRAEIPEEVGSSSKPYVLATAVNEGMSVLTSKLNGYAPLAIPYAPAGSSNAQITATENMKSSLFKGPGGESLSQDNAVFNFDDTWYKVFNEQGENLGALKVNAATALSSDAAYEDLAHRAGIDNIIQMYKNLGVGQNPFNEYCETGGTVKEMRACSDLYGTNGLYANFSTDTKLCNPQKTQTCGSPQITFGESPLTPVEQASTFATLADGGVYHSPHVIARVLQGTTVLPSHLVSRVVLRPAVAHDVAWALSFDNNYPGGTAEGSVTFRPGGIIAKTGTLGTGANANIAWFVGATPNQYSLSVALYTELAGGKSENLNNLPAVGDQTGGEFGGAWPAQIWNTQMIKMDGSGAPGTFQLVNQVFPITNAGFKAWIQVTAPKPKKPNTCGRLGILHQQNCQCPGQGNGHGNGQQCNPNPTQTQCPPLTVCNTASPSPSSSPSSSPSPPASASPSPSPSDLPSPATAEAAEEASSAVRIGLRSG